MGLGHKKSYNLVLPDTVRAVYAANKTYVDSALTGLDTKDSVRVASEVNLTLTGTLTVDSIITTAGDRVLVKAQTDAKTNTIVYTKANSNVNVEKVQGILIQGLPFVSVSAWPYTLHDLETAKHTTDLPTRHLITLNVDYNKQAVGGDNSWGAKPMKKYRLIKNITYKYQFTLHALQNLDDYYEFLH